MGGNGGFVLVDDQTDFAYTAMVSIGPGCRSVPEMSYRVWMGGSSAAAARTRSARESTRIFRMTRPR